MTEPAKSPQLSWKEKAGCLTHHVSLFYPAVQRSNSKKYGRTIANAIKVCMDCEVANECYKYAMSNDEKNGVWGGVNFHHNMRGTDEAFRKRVQRDRASFVIKYRKRKKVKTNETN